MNYKGNRMSENNIIDNIDSINVFEQFSNNVTSSIEALNQGLITKEEAYENIEMAVLLTKNKIKTINPNQN